MKANFTRVIAILLVIPVIFGVLANLFISAGVADAAVFDRAERRGFFTNNPTPAGTGNGPVVPDGIHADNINQFVSIMKGFLNSSDQQKRTAASFMIRSMMGARTGSASQRNLGADTQLVRTWEIRVRQYASRGWVEFEDTRTTYTNTLYAPNIDDVAWYGGDLAVRTDERITFFNGPVGSPGVEPLYQIRKECANPLGNTYALPDISDWSTTRSSAVSVNGGSFQSNRGESNPVTVYPGQTVQFRHQVTANGVGINYNVRVDGKGRSNADFNTGSSSGINHHTARDGQTSGTNYPINNSTRTQMTFSLSEVGTTYCQRVRTAPSEYSNGTRVSPNERSSAYVCVRVAANPWSIRPESRVRTSSTDYVMTTGAPINVSVGDRVLWQHTAVNPTNYAAPGSNSDRGYRSFGYTMTYGNFSSPTGTSDSDPWVRRLGVSSLSGVSNNLPDIAANSTRHFYASATDNAALAHSGLSRSYGNSSQTYTRNNNSQPPTDRIILPEDVGMRLCQRAYVGNYRDSGGNLRAANPACVYVPYVYDLEPCVVKGSSGGCGGVDEPKERGTTTSDLVTTVTNNGGTRTKDVTFKISQWTVPASRESVSTPTDHINNTNSDPCAVYHGVYGINQSQSNCEITREETRTFNNARTTLTGINDLTIPSDAELGTRFCYAISINNYSLNEDQTESQQNAGSNQWRHSPPYCILVVKYPKMQIWSNGVYSAGGIQTNTTTIGGDTFGSWVEYEALASKAITGGFGSAAAPRETGLTLSNNTSGSPGNWGGWTATSTESVISNLEARYPYNGTSGSSLSFNFDAEKNVEVGKTTAANYVLNNTSDFTRSAAGRTVVIMAPDTDIHINRNIISRNPTSGDVNDFQQFIIVGKNIYIGGEVDRIDAWLISTDEIFTCARPNGSGRLRSDASWVDQSTCGRSLRINGPIIANNLNSWRTGGSDTDSLDEPAEIYNQRPDTYIWAYGQSGGAGRVITTYSRELPVRF